MAETSSLENTGGAKMYAIIQTGGKQYRVRPGDVIRVEKLDHKLGSEFELTDVLLVGGEKQNIGTPTVKNAKVTLVVTKQTKDRKVIIFKKKRRQGYRRFKTHRQPFTELFVKAIVMDGQSAKADSEPNIVDVDQVRMERIQARSLAPAVESGEEAPVKKVRATKKVASKKAAAKKPSKKKTATKKAKKAKG
jgi:large subunit ribosomal protein L21